MSNKVNFPRILRMMNKLTRSVRDLADRLDGTDEQARRRLRNLDNKFDELHDDVIEQGMLVDTIEERLSSALLRIAQLEDDLHDRETDDG